MSRRILRGILEGGGHNVIEADEGMVALEQYFLEKPDLVLLDLIMKGMLGLEVLKKLKEMDPDVRVIVGTADIQTSTVEMTRAGGAAGFVTKPFVAQNVLAAVKSALEGGR